MQHSYRHYRRDYTAEKAMNDDDAVIEAARAIRPCLDAWPIPGAAELRHAFAR